MSGTYRGASVSIGENRGASESIGERHISGWAGARLLLEAGLRRAAAAGWHVAMWTRALSCGWPARRLVPEDTPLNDGDLLILSRERVRI